MRFWVFSSMYPANNLSLSTFGNLLQNPKYYVNGFILIIISFFHSIDTWNEIKLAKIRCDSCTYSLTYWQESVPGYAIASKMPVLWGVGRTSSFNKQIYLNIKWIVLALNAWLRYWLSHRPENSADSEHRCRNSCKLLKFITFQRQSFDFQLSAEIPWLSGLLLHWVRTRTTRSL